MLIDTNMPGYGIPWPMIATAALASALFLVFVIGMALKSRRAPLSAGVKN